MKWPTTRYHQLQHLCQSRVVRCREVYTDPLVINVVISGLHTRSELVGMVAAAMPCNRKSRPLASLEWPRPRYEIMGAILYVGVIHRVEPTAHEFRARRGAMLLSASVILYIAVDGTIQSGSYGIIEIARAEILELALAIAFVWSVYRFRVVCFDRFQEYHKKACTLANYNIHLELLNFSLALDLSAVDAFSLAFSLLATASSD